MLTPLLPLCPGIANARGMRGTLFSWIPLSAFAVGAFLAVIVPQFSVKAPERVNFQYWQDADTGAAQWIVQPASGRLPEPIAVAAAFKRADKGPFPWDRGPAYFTPAPRLTASEPSFTILESSLDAHLRKYRALLRSNVALGSADPVSSEIGRRKRQHAGAANRTRRRQATVLLRRLERLPLPRSSIRRRADVLHLASWETPAIVCGRCQLWLAVRRPVPAELAPAHRGAVARRRRHSDQPGSSTYPLSAFAARRSLVGSRPASGRRVLSALCAAVRAWPCAVASRCHPERAVSRPGQGGRAASRRISLRFSSSVCGAIRGNNAASFPPAPLESVGGVRHEKLTGAQAPPLLPLGCRRLQLRHNSGVISWGFSP